MAETEIGEKDPAPVVGEGKKGYGPQKFENWREELKIPLRTKIGLGVSAGISAATIALACKGDGGGPEVGYVPVGNETPTVVVITPTEETTIPGTNIPKPDITPVTPGPVELGKGGGAQTETPTSNGPSETTPAPPETEAPSREWDVIVDPAIEGTVSSVSKRTIEQDLEIVNGALEKLPVLKGLKVVLKAGQISEYRPELNEAWIARDLVTPELIQFGLVHEVFHYLDPVLNEHNLSQAFTSEQIEELKSIREATLTDELWGVDYPDLEKIFSADKLNFSRSLTKQQTEEQLATLSDILPDSVWVAGKRNNQVGANKSFEPLYQKQWDRIQALAKEASGESPYDNIVAFINGNSAEIEVMSRENPLFARAVQMIKDDAELFQLKNTFWLRLAPINFQLGAKELESWWLALPTYINMELKEAYVGGDAGVHALVLGRDRLRIDQGLAQSRAESDEEAWAEKGAVIVFYGVNNPINSFLADLAK